MSMQLDACLIKEQIGTLLVWVGALEGGLGGGSSGVCTPKSKRVVPPKRNTLLFELIISLAHKF